MHNMQDLFKSCFRLTTKCFLVMCEDNFGTRPTSRVSRCGEYGDARLLSCNLIINQNS